MLFRPAVHQNLDAIALALSSWNAQADHFREAARSGQSDALTLAAAHEAYDAIGALIGRMDEAFLELKPGHPGYSPLLRMLNTALALEESIGRSLDALDMVREDVAVEAPVRLDHRTDAIWAEPWRVAAE